MYKLIINMKNGTKYNLKCEDYTIESNDGSITRFKYFGGIGECPIYMLFQDIESIIEEKEEPPTGKWELDIDEEIYKGSECGKSGLSSFDMIAFDWQHDKYCSNCGAKMSS